MTSVTIQRIQIKVCGPNEHSAIPTDSGGGRHRPARSKLPNKPAKHPINRIHRTVSGREVHGARVSNGG